jgi:glycosyltransferase involved in cell wall biosynthesis
MRVGLVIDGTDRFVLPIEAELKRRHQCERFRPRFVRLPLIGKRVNDWLLRKQLQRFIASQDVTLFEWAASLLILATHLPVQGKLVTRLHAGEIAGPAYDVDWARVDGCIVLSDSIRRHLQEIAPVTPSKIRVINNGVDVRRFAPVPKPFQHRLGLVGRLVPTKRVYDLVLALYWLRQRGYPYTLHIAGEFASNYGEEGSVYEFAVRSVISRLGLADHVVFHGYVEDVAAWLQDVDVFVSHSYYEGQQVALLEAMASGCCCLAHCWEGADEVLPSDCIYVTEQQLSEMLIILAEMDAEKRMAWQARMGAIAQERFDERRMVNQAISFLEEVAIGR